MDAKALALLKDSSFSENTLSCIFGQKPSNTNTLAFEGYTFVVVNLMNVSINLPAEQFVESF